MKPAELEDWALRIIERLKAGQPLEDDRVELKADWPASDDGRAARRIAGHANAARLEPILWLIGADEKARRVSGASAVDPASWLAQVRRWFEGLAPEQQCLAIPVDGVSVVALLFDTSRAPFVIKNLAGTSGGPVTHEVPFRSGTDTRSARRADLVRILVPIQRLPVVEVLGGSLVAHDRGRERGDPSPSWGWQLFVDLYLTPASTERCVIPFHRCSGWFQGPLGEQRVALDEVELGSVRDSYIITCHSEVILEGPGSAWLKATAVTPQEAEPMGAPAVLQLDLLPIGAEAPVLIRVELPYKGPKLGATGEDKVWTLPQA